MLLSTELLVWERPLTENKVGDVQRLQHMQRRNPQRFDAHADL